MVMYALHDGLVKAMPDNPMTPSLAESWKASPDGRVYDFTLRKGVKFHNGDTVTAEDVKFSFDRYKGTAAATLKERVAAVETPGPLHVRIRLKNPWPDFLTFYTAASGASFSYLLPRLGNTCGSTHARVCHPGGTLRRASLRQALREEGPHDAQTHGCSTGKVDEHH